ncbi:DNA-binding response regulator [Rhodococcoides trifolii]|uniref:DNA-binding response regulator n=1 Tax=Rhodococcoides trifolii TaxID=908250 RepID=A0A917FU56_9NOCA|nr:response regulator transcription factor [Rhodococcus trifolii]GGG01518.1 DNA-binding response regulator [Rhodococcus trifolii]
MTETQKIRVALVDDHPIVRAGFRALLENEPDLDVVGEAESGATAVELVSSTAPDVVLMDLRMPGGDGVTATRELKKRFPTVAVIVVTTYETDADILRAVEAGATGYLLKDARPDELTGAIRGVFRGETVLSPNVAARLVRSIRGPKNASLSPREKAVLALVADGKTNSDIGAALFITEATVKTHLLRIFGKLDVSDRTAAVTTALDRGELP